MKRILVICLSLIFISSTVLGQELYMPRSVKPAYQSGFRSRDGRPTDKYFQNRSKHDIQVSVSPPDRTVTGSETIEYTNNSPMPMAVVLFRFELNVHAPEAMRERLVDASELAPPVSVDQFSVDGKAVAWMPLIPNPASTFNAVRLEKPIPPGGKRTFGFKWHYKLVAGEGREGAIDPTSFYLAYFYPRVAVFDDVAGWDQTPHVLSHEFYGDFNDYQVAVTVPKNYLVWGTGELLNAEEVLQGKYADKLEKSFTSDDIVTISTPEELKEGKVTAQTDTVTWKWKADNVSDVAFGLSDHYQWDASSVVVDNKTGRRASTQSAYDLKSKNFSKMVEYIKTSLKFGSFDTPGVPYPYPKMTIFRGFADMEYPMMANDSEMGSPQMQEFVAAHEILHTYFPFYMGINERRYSFMEEGWTTAFEYIFNSERFGEPFAATMFKNFRVRGWINSSNPGADIPIMTPEDSMTGSAYGNNKYGRAALGYLALRDLLGKEEFGKALREFMSRWHGKHPTPWDMFYSFNSATGKDLNWFWNAWFFSRGYIDYGVKGVSGNGAEGYGVTVLNEGGFPAPFDLIVTYTDGDKETLHQTPGLWEKNMNQATIKLDGNRIPSTVQIDGGIWMDANPRDNQWAADGSGAS